MIEILDTAMRVCLFIFKYAFPALAVTIGVFIGPYIMLTVIANIYTPLGGNSPDRLSVNILAIISLAIGVLFFIALVTSGGQHVHSHRCVQF